MPCIPEAMDIHRPDMQTKGWQATSQHTLQPNVSRHACRDGCPCWCQQQPSGTSSLAQEVAQLKPLGCATHTLSQHAAMLIFASVCWQSPLPAHLLHPNVIMLCKVEKILLPGSIFLQVYLGWHLSNWENYVWSSLRYFWRQTLKTLPNKSVFF